MYTFGERLGMLFPVLGGSISTIAASLVLLLAVVRWLRRTASKRARRPDAADNIIFLNLMLADLIQGLGELPIIRWLADGVITEGRLCTAQGFVKTFGGDGAALSSMAIAAHTFCVLVLCWRAPKYLSRLVVLIIWIFIALVIVIPYSIHRNQRFYGNAGHWCWVRTAFKTEQLVTEYIWLWGSSILMGILYTTMFAVMRRWFIVENHTWYWHKNYMPRNGDDELVEETEEEKDSKAIANLLLLYPMVYLICIVPHSIVRWRFFSGHRVPYQATLFTATLFSLSGAFNAILFFFTRPDLVVGTADVSAVAPSILEIHSAKNGGSPSSSMGRLGSLPIRTPTSSGYISPGIEMDYIAHPYNSNSLAEGPNGNIRASPRQVESDLGIRNYPPYLSGERSYGDSRSKHDLALTIEEESYGHLPG